VTPLHEVVSGGGIEHVNALMLHGADISAQDWKLRTPLHQAALLEYSAPLIPCLMSYGADINAVDENTQTPLHLAARYGFDSVVRALLETQKANQMILDKFGRTPVIAAAYEGHNSTIKVFESFSVVIEYNSLLREAALKRRVDTVVELLENKSQSLSLPKIEGIIGEINAEIKTIKQERMPGQNSFQRRTSIGYCNEYTRIIALLNQARTPSLPAYAQEPPPQEPPPYTYF
jgi:ankyrin repeat protein